MTTVTTAGSSGAPQDPEGGAPQEDDPFGYLYRPADGGSGQQAEPQQGVPRTSYNRPMEVGRAQYGQPPRPQQPYPPQQPGYPQAQPPQQPYPPQGDFGAAPTQQTRYAEHSRPQPGEERPPSGGRSKGAVIGAVAVVAAIAIGAGIALSGDPDKDTDKDAKGGSTASAPAAPGGATGTASPSGSASATPAASASAGPGTVDATQLQGQNAPAGNTVKGTKSADGSYLTLNPGGTITWTGDVPAAGTFKFTVHFNNPGADTKAIAAVNGKDWPGGLGLKNYSPGKDPASSWYTSYITPPLQAGSNTIVLSLAPGSPTILVDQVTLEAAG
ncbi:hypothetical protein [Kitasatospora sp. NPDC056184]|uniref:hypothetical protein n=1 Tax=Kitasatospora sp. NPDC056184 TaxID=3345738 RepID=UPI0035D6E3A5